MRCAELGEGEYLYFDYTVPPLLLLLLLLSSSPPPPLFCSLPLLSFFTISSSTNSNLHTSLTPVLQQDLTMGVCDWPYNVDCQTTTTTPAPTTTTPAVVEKGDWLPYGRQHPFISYNPPSPRKISLA